MAKVWVTRIALDTNVPVRFLVPEDFQQTAQANVVFTNLTDEYPAWLCREVLLDLVWVLERAYRLPRTDIARALHGLLSAQEMVVEHADRVGLAVERYRQGGVEFSEHLIALAPAMRAAGRRSASTGRPRTRPGRTMVPEFT